ncbi:MAG TPA: hypothetical protein VFQ44_29610 [Streptosporangiaceae bacterium]|nr:hypothetical protein [Streptosporangiaceae bacterium]
MTRYARTVIAAGAAGLLVSGAGVAVYNVIQITQRQQLTPIALLGRSTGSIRLFVTGSVDQEQCPAGAMR